MAINTIGGSTSSLPAGATGIVFSGISTIGDYTYTTSLPIGKYILQGYSANGNGCSWVSNSNKDGGPQVAPSGSPILVNITTTEAAFEPYNVWTNTTGAVQFGWSASIYPGPLVTNCWATNGTLVILPNQGTSGYIITTTDAITWTSRDTNQSTKANTINIAYGAGLTNGWISTYAGSVNNQLSTSTDGISWTARTVPASFQSTSATWSVINSAATQKYVLTSGIVNNGVATSTDGVTWTTRTISPGGSGILTGVATNGTASTNQIYVAPVGGSALIATSTDGVTWGARALPITALNTNGAVGFGAGIYFIPSSTNTAYATSTDGVTWTSRTKPAGSGVVFVSGKFYTEPPAGGYTFGSSTDGITWSNKNFTNSAFGSAPGNGLFFAVNGMTYFAVDYTRLMFTQPAYFSLYSTTGTSTLN